MKDNRECKRQTERGAVAVEFALTFPLFVALLGFGISIGLTLWSQQQMLDCATTAARFCAFNLPQVNDTAALATCAQNTVADRLSNSKIIGCTSTPVVSVSFPAINGSTVNHMGMLQVKLSCSNTWYSMMNAVGSTMGGKDYPMSVVGTMPFIQL